MTTTQYVPTRTGMTVDAFKRALLDNLYYIPGNCLPFYGKCGKLSPWLSNCRK